MKEYVKNEQVTSPSPSICYILNGEGWTRHAQMAWLSMSSLRSVHPDANIILVIDQCSEEGLDANCKGLQQLATSIVVVHSEFEDLSLRNRDLRIRLRETIDGDFLYIDGDTIFVGSIEGTVFPAPIRAVPDFNVPVDAGPAGHSQIIRDFLGSVGWPLPSRQFNGGVLMIRECSGAERFCAAWQDNWRAIVERLRDAADTGVPWGEPEQNARLLHVADQLAFDHTASQLTGIVEPAPNEYNAMVCTAPHLARHARILHFFSAPEQMAGTLLQHMLQHLERTGEYDAAAVDRCRKEGHPWAPNPEAWQYRRSQHYAKAILRKLGVSCR